MYRSASRPTRTSLSFSIQLFISSLCLSSPASFCALCFFPLLPFSLLHFSSRCFCLLPGSTFLTSSCTILSSSSAFTYPLKAISSFLVLFAFRLLSFSPVPPSFSLTRLFHSYFPHCCAHLSVVTLLFISLAQFLLPSLLLSYPSKDTVLSSLHYSPLTSVCLHLPRYFVPAFHLSSSPPLFYHLLPIHSLLTSPFLLPHSFFSMFSLHFHV